MASLLTRNRSLPALLTALALVAGALVSSDAALADSRPADPTNKTTPVTVAADALPTPQINGVAWTQTVVGNTVFVGGHFSTARPSGVALKGAGTVSRSNILAYDIRTGGLSTTFKPVVNGDVRTITASADKKSIYIGGTFTKIGSGSKAVSRSRVAKLSASTGALVTAFKASATAQVNSLALGSKGLYIGGTFLKLNGVTRSAIGLVNPTTGRLASWHPVLSGGPVQAMVLTPDRSRIIVGGSFTTANGSSRYGDGLAALSTNKGGTLPWAAATVIRNGGSNGAVSSLSIDSTGVYGTGFVYHGSGKAKANFEGAFRADWKTGKVLWIADCHGDAYSIAVSPTAAYVAGHSRDCNTVGGFPSTRPQTYTHAIAFSKAATGTVRTSSTSKGYTSFAGKPSPTLLNWFPHLSAGTYTGKSQAAYNVVATADYVLYAGEFPTVNGTPQQGLTRFAVTKLAPNTTGPSLSGARFKPVVTPVGVGALRVSFAANTDADNGTLSYEVYRDKDFSNPVYTVSATSSVWYRPGLGFVDTGLTPGVTYSYRVRATDAFGNTALGDPVFVAASDTAPGLYQRTVLSQKAAHFWRLDGATGAISPDLAGNLSVKPGKGVTGGAAGSSRDGTGATVFNGTPQAYQTTSLAPIPKVFTVSAWFKTTATAGGKIVGYRVLRDYGNVAASDHGLYVNSKGAAAFGTYSGSRLRTLGGTTKVNDGKWHQIVGVASTTGMALYVDGKRITSRSTAITPRTLVGSWYIGTDSTYSGNTGFTGTIDDVSTYDVALSASQIATQYRAATVASATE